MIARIHATLRQVRGHHAYLEVGPVWYEVTVPTSVADRLPPVGQVVTLHTFAYIENTSVGGNGYQRLFGFLDEVEKEFFELLTRVSGLGMKKAARAMAIPVSRIAAAIERSDERVLKGLPEIGPKTARKIIAELQGKVGKFALLRESNPVPSGIESTSDSTSEPGQNPSKTDSAAGKAGAGAMSEREVVEECVQILTSLNYTEREADVLIDRALAIEPHPTDSDQLIQVIFRQNAPQR